MVSLFISWGTIIVSHQHSSRFPGDGRDFYPIPIHLRVPSNELHQNIPDMSKIQLETYHRIEIEGIVSKEMA